MARRARRRCVRPGPGRWAGDAAPLPIAANRPSARATIGDESRLSSCGGSGGRQRPVATSRSPWWSRRQRASCSACRTTTYGPGALSSRSSSPAPVLALPAREDHGMGSRPEICFTLATENCACPSRSTPCRADRASPAHQPRKAAGYRGDARSTSAAGSIRSRETECRARSLADGQRSRWSLPRRHIGKENLPLRLRKHAGD